MEYAGINLVLRLPCTIFVYGSELGLRGKTGFVCLGLDCFCRKIGLYVRSRDRGIRDCLWVCDLNLKDLDMVEDVSVKRIGLACDHAGYEMKEYIKSWLEVRGYLCRDFGTYSAESVDYADYAHPLALSIESGDCCLGIAICGSGNGINMTLNKHQHIRAALCWTEELSMLARAHNDANVLVLPGRFIDLDAAVAIVGVFLSTSFEGGRHSRRIAKIPVL